MPPMVPPYKTADPAGLRFQYLEDLATGYWYSQCLFTAVELRLFHHIEKAAPDTFGLSRAAGCRLPPLGRLLEALSQMELVSRSGGRWYNQPLARKYLLPAQPDYMGDFLLYRRFLQPNWSELSERVAGDATRWSRLSAGDDYGRRNYHYVRASDRLARLKSREIAAVCAQAGWNGPVLDVGGGAGALCRRLLGDRPGACGILLDLPEVLSAARRLYPLAEHWRNLLPVACDFRYAAPFPAGGTFGLVLVSNFLHAYGPAAAQELLARGRDRLAEDGLLVIHDYFPDVFGAVPPRGGLHDVNMMLNTADGVCHNAATVVSWLRSMKLENACVVPLASDSALILAGTRPLPRAIRRRPDVLVQKAVEIGFRKALPLDPAAVITEPWVQVKCRFGCARYGGSRQCPPHTPDAAETARLLASYGSALLLVDQPPAKRFHDRLLEVEKAAFLSGCHKALVFGAGPCVACESCRPDRPCRFPDRARPSMEASGIDVYGTARRCGLNLEPVTDTDGYVKYLGLLLLE